MEIIQKEIKSRGGIYKLVQGPTRIGTRVDDVDNEDIIANMNKKMEEEGSDEEENNEEGMGDLDSDDEDIHQEEEGEENE